MIRILIVEDDPLIALGLSQMISDELGAETLVASRVAEAENLLDLTAFHFVLLDVNLGQDTSYDLARRLIARRIPCAFTSGSRQENMPADLHAIAFLSKPATTQRLLGLVRNAIMQETAPPGAQDRHTTYGGGG